MGTRATVHFRGPWNVGAGPFDSSQNPKAIVYRHFDGNPSGLGEDLRKFFAEVITQTKDTRFTDPSYLAAKFVVWQAGEYAEEDYKNGQWVKRDPPRPLDFRSVGVVLEDPDDIEFRYHVLASESNGVPPMVLVEQPEGDDAWKLLGGVDDAIRAENEESDE